MVVQTAAVLEILHSILRLVRSPVLSAIIQVSSRVLLLWPYTFRSKTAQQHWSLYLMVLSWCLVEVVRYIFYGLKALKIDVPKPFMWLRYSLFIVLYPSGILGEILQILQSCNDLSPTAVRFALFQLALYIPGSPYMIRNMWRMRRRAFEASNKKKAPPTPRPANGLSWPTRDAKTGKPSTTPTNVAIWEAAMRSTNAEKADAIARDSRKWRFKYVRHVLANVTESMKNSENALAIAKAGLEEAYSQFTFVRDGKESQFREAMQQIKGSFKTHVIHGEGKKPSEHVYTVAYRDQSDGQERHPTENDNLSGDALKRQLKKWASAGVIEGDCAQAIASVVENQATWCDLSDIYFVILGATSAMGPIHVLLKHGANVIACDIQSRGPPGGGDGPFRGPWKNLIKWARASCGKLYLPVPEGTELEGITDSALERVAGCNLLTQTPEIANWLCGICPDEQLIIGNYTYLDGGLHVLLSIACDAIINKLAVSRVKKTMACFLCTPTDDHVIPTAAADAIKDNLKNAPLWQKLVQILVPRKHGLKSNVATESGGLHCVRAISSTQGPNYALAKRLQHWRAMILFDRGHAVSSNIAPSTRTLSVIHNKMIGMAYNGFPAFKPLEVMYQETSNAVMGALLIHDIRNTNGVARQGEKLDHPLQLFSKNSFHGGVWRCGIELESIGLWAIVYTLRASIAGAVALLGSVAGFVIAGPDVSSLLDP
jgi:hypothetical protein